MAVKAANPTTLALAGGVIGSGNKISSAAIHPEYNPAIALVQRLQRACRVSAPHSATIVRLAQLGPVEGR